MNRSDGFGQKRAARFHDYRDTAVRPERHIDASFRRMRGDIQGC